MPPCEIPYVAQEDARSCGPAALCMVYRSLGVSCTQAELRPTVTRTGRGGIVSAHTHLLCRDALGRGFRALIVRARNPWEMLRQCSSHGVRAVLNHRPRVGSASGHYSVLVSADDETIVLHDPLAGPEMRYRREEFLPLWGPAWPGGEVPGNVMVAISSGPNRVPCAGCGEELPAEEACAWCKQRIGLEPGVVLGCGNEECPGRWWSCYHCPGCDMGQFDRPGKMRGFSHESHLERGRPGRE